MYFTVSQRLKHLSKTDYQTLRELSHIAKNLTNEAIYNIRQQYFTNKTFLTHVSNNRLLKNSPNYKLLNSNMAQQILKEVDNSFQSFFGLLKRAKQGAYAYSKCRLPKYLSKDGFATLVIGFVRIKDDTLLLPFSNTFRTNHDRVVIKLPPILRQKKIKEIRILPKCNARFFDIQYVYELQNDQRNLNIHQALALDFGVNNLVTAVSSDGHSFLLDGRRLKSMNQWYHKENVRLQRIKDKQRYGKQLTKRQQLLLQKRNRQVYDYLHKVARYIIHYCICHNIGTLVVGYNKTMQQNVHMGTQNNQNFVSIPYGKLRDYLEYLCAFYGMRFVEQEESYTSKASFFDKDVIPVYDASNVTAYTFCGRRIFRGLYETSTGKRLNADVNGALNILRKSNVVDLGVLYSRGDVDTPMRIRVS